MNVLVATDGSKYGRWALNWVARLPLVEPPHVTALHVLDVAAFRAPFLAQPVMAGNEPYIQEEITRMEAHSAKFHQDQPTSKGGRVPIHVSVFHVLPLVMRPGLKKASKTLLEHSVQKLIKAGFTAESLCDLGNTAEEIMKVASQQRADLIVMGAQGLGAIARFLIGSVSTRVVQHANVSVLVVR